MNTLVRLISLSLLMAGCNGSSGSIGFAGTLLSVVSTGAETGKQGKLRVTFDNPLAADTNVMLTSSSPSVATIGDHVTVPKGAVSAELAWSGVAPGQTTFYATAGAATQLTSASVVDHFTVQSMGANDPTLEKGATTIVYVNLNASTPDPVMLALAAADATVVGVPANVAISPWSSTGRATLNALTVGTTTLTAMDGSDSVSTNINVVDHARLSASSSLQSQVMEVGGTIVSSIAVDATVAMPAPVAATSSDATVAAAPANLVIPSGQRSAVVRIPILGAGMTTLGFTLADSSLSVTLTGVAALHLLSVGVSTPLQVGVNTNGSISMDAVAGVPHQIALTSSDPTIVAVPAQVAVGPGSSSASFAVNPLKGGTVTISASFGGTTVSTLVYVASAGSALQLDWYQTRRMLVGASNEITIYSTASNVQLTSSTAGVLGFLPTVNVPSYSYAYPVITALAAGSTTLTATSGSLSSSVDIQVVTTPDLALGPAFYIAPGTSTNGELDFQALAPTGTYVTFTSSNTNVLATPPAVTLGSTDSGLSFQLSGLAPGTAILTATTMGVSKTAVVYVGPNSTSPVYLSNLYVNDGLLEVGAATYVTVQLTSAAAADTPIMLKVSPAPVASLTDATPVLVAGSSNLYVPLVAKAAGTAMVSATAGGITLTNQVTVVTTPTFTISLQTTIDAGNAVNGSISSDCLLATDRQVSLNSSDTAVAVVTPASVTLPTGTRNADFEVRGVTPGTTNINYAPSPLPSPSPMPVVVTVQ